MVSTQNKIDITETDDKTVMLVKIVSNIVSTQRARRRGENSQTKRCERDKHCVCVCIYIVKDEQVYVCGRGINKMKKKKTKLKNDDENERSEREKKTQAVEK